MSSGSGDAPYLRNDKSSVLGSRIYAQLQSYESAILYLQRVLVWERPSHSIAFFFLMHVAFFYLSMRSNHVIGFLSTILLILVFLDMWKHKIWPEIRAVSPDAEAEWGELHPKLLSLQEMCQTLAEAFLIVEFSFDMAVTFRRQFPGKFCALFSFACVILSVIGQKIPGVFLSYAIMICLMLWPLVWYHRILEKSYTKIEPFFMQLQYTLRQRSTTTQYLTQYVNRSPEVLAGKVHDSDDDDDDISEFIPQLNEKTAEVLARAITDDSELSETDEEILAQELPTFSRASTPDNLVANETYLATLPQQIPTSLNDTDDEDDFGLPNPDFNQNTQRQRIASTYNETLASQMLANSDIVSTAIGNVIKDTFSNIVQKIQPPSTSDSKPNGSNSSTPTSDFEFIELDHENQSLDT